MDKCKQAHCLIDKTILKKMGGVSDSYVGDVDKGKITCGNPGMML